MATLQKIRDKGVLLVVVIGIALAAFVLGDLFTSGSTFLGKARDRAFVINGEIISTQTYASKIAEFEHFQKMVSGQSSLDETTTTQIREAVYQQMVRERLLGDQAKKLGLVVSKAEINDLVHGSAISPILQQLPFFVNPETGMFDRSGLMEFLNVINTPVSDAQEQALVDEYKSLWMFIEDMIKSQRLEEKYISLLTNALVINDDEAKLYFDLSQRNADIAFAMQSYFTVSDSAVTVTDKEIRDYYDKNKKSYHLEAPMVKISYFTKEIVPSSEDVEEVMAESQIAYEQLQSATNPAPVVADYSEIPYLDVYLGDYLLSPTQLDFARSASVNDMFGPVQEENSFQVFKLIDKTVAPDSVRLSMMSVPDASMIGQDSIITNFIDSIYDAIRDGEPFADVAYALNPASNGGDVGWAREIDLISLGSEAVKTIFNAPVGKPVKMSVPGQQLILQVEEKTRPVTKYKLAIVDMPVLPSEKTSNNVDNELNQFVSNENVETNFASLASEQGYMVMPSTAFSANDYSIRQIPNSRQVITWAVNEKKMGTVRKFDLTNLRIVARVDQVIPAGTTPLSEVSESIRTQLLNDKKADYIIEDLSSRNLSSLSEYASAMDSETDTVRFVNFTTRNITGIGFEPVFNAVSAYAPVNSVIAPLKGNMGVYAITVIERTEGAEPYDAEEQKFNMMNNNAYRLQTQSVEVLKDKLGVEDNRYKFF